jgi:hypothetical protein
MSWMGNARLKECEGGPNRGQIGPKSAQTGSKIGQNGVIFVPLFLSRARPASHFRSNRLVKREFFALAAA